MRDLVIYACLLTGLFYFSEGKPCPEKSRPHKTRCDAFYKCRELPSNSHVWVPVKCKEGLVYEHNVGSCVLPGEDWECITPSEMMSTSTSQPSKSNHIIIVDNKDDTGLVYKEQNDDNVEIVLESALSSEEDQDEAVAKLAEISPDLGDSSAGQHFDSSGDGELVELEGLSQVQLENREGDANDNHSNSQGTKTATATILSTSLHSGGDQGTSTNPSSSSPIDPNLTAHLQRLSQLIDGLQQTYQKTDKPQMDLRPDQLNAFLAHFDLKNRYDMLNPVGTYKDSPPDLTTTTTPRATTAMLTESTTATPPSTLPEPNVNKTQLQEHLSKHRLQPETKLLLSSASPFSSYGPGYANSQIVVNRPEGSVMFTLPQYGLSSEQTQSQPQHGYGHTQSHEYPGDHEPKISEETLKTVLELSKQMIAAQNVPKVLPNAAYNNAYYGPPILQPVILSPHSNPFQQYYPMGSYDAVQPPRTHYMHHKKQKPSVYSNKKQPSTTIIHNNVIPVHLSSTSSGEKEVLDTYGNSLGVYPNLDKHHQQQQQQQQDSASNNNNYYNKFIATMTTARPSTSSISVTTMSNQYAGQYAAPYSSEFTLTTPHPFVQQPTASTVAAYYTPSPHLNEQNVNSIFQADSYPTSMGMNVPRPMMDSQGMFPAQLEPGQVKIRPNSHKIESMEVDADEAINANYVNSNGNGQNQIHSGNNHPHVLTYSSGIGGSDMLGMSQQLTPGGSYVEHSYTMSQNAANDQHHHHNQYKSPVYLPRPLATPTPTPTPSMSSSIYSDTAGNVGLSMFSSGLGSLTAPGSTHLHGMLPGKSKYPSGAGQLVNFNGNFISLDVFQKSILPLMTQSPSALSELGKVEVITCQAGVRQPNQTDCTRYFVCSKKDGKVLSYSCPPYTGFNKQTRICDAQTYAQCGNMPIFNGYSIEENRRQQIETLKVLAEAKRRQEAALKAQSIANLLQQYGTAQEATAPGASSDSMEHNLLDSYMVSFPDPSTTARPILAAASPTLSPLSSTITISTGISGGVGTGSGSGISTNGSSSSSSSGGGSVKKRKYYCKEGDKIPDQTSISSYFVCYKNAQGQMKGHKMTCSKALVFCPKTLMCTLASKCTG